MRLKKPEILRLAKGLLAAPDKACDCHRAAEWLPAAVDAAIAGADLAQAFPELVIHLELCGACRQEFRDLLAVARMHEANALPQPARYPHFSLQQLQEREASATPAAGWSEFLIRFRRYLDQVRAGTGEAGAGVLRDIVRAGERAFALLLQPTRPSFQALPTRHRPAVETPQLSYTVAALGLTLTLKVREFDRHRFTIRGLIEAAQSFAGLGICLLPPDDDDPLDCTQVDSANTFSFHEVGPGHYRVRLDITETEALTLTDVDI